MCCENIFGLYPPGQMSHRWVFTRQTSVEPDATSGGMSWVPRLALRAQLSLHPQPYKTISTHLVYMVKFEVGVRFRHTRDPCMQWPRVSRLCILALHVCDGDVAFASFGCSQTESLPLHREVECVWLLWVWVPDLTLYSLCGGLRPPYF